MKIAPLSGSFMAGSIIGIMVTYVYMEKLGLTWGTTLILFFIMTFIASLISMTYGDPDPQLSKRSRTQAIKTSPVKEGTIKNLTKQKD